MQIIRYFEQENKTPFVDILRTVDWSAAKFLVSLLEEDRFFTMLGGEGDILFLMDGEKLVSFITLTRQDSIRDESMYPWIGFVWTQPEYRGHRYAGVLLAEAEKEAARQGHRRVHVATDHVGLYEKYGYTYLENRIDFWGDNERVLYKDL